AYALWLYRRVVFGELTKDEVKAMLDLSTREKAIIYPLVALTLFFGVYPAPILDATAASVDALVTSVQQSIDSAAALAAKN
ncbi:MAG: NADH-quinone oxidoreductase subunit M, partial [Notoacmeibacter sp.]